MYQSLTAYKLQRQSVIKITPYFFIYLMKPKKNGWIQRFNLGEGGQSEIVQVLVNIKKFFCSKTTGPISIKLDTNHP